jgi:hypothetical protein
MAGIDYIPGNDDIQTVVFTAATTNATKWLIPAQALSALGTKRARWTAALAAYRNRAVRTPLQ